MGNVFVIIRQGIFASLTGGWVYEPQQDNFCNAVHLYMWLFLLCFPLVLFWTAPFTSSVWIAYCCSVAVIFVIIKLFNYRLHAMFDNKDTKTIILPEAVSSNHPSDDADKNCKAAFQENTQNVIETSEGIEMIAVAASSQWVASPGMTPPVLCSSRMSVSDSSGSGRKLKKQDGSQANAGKVLEENSDLKINCNDSEWKICSTDAILNHHQSERIKNRSLVKTGSISGTKYRETYPIRNASCGYSFINVESCDLQASHQNAGNSPHVSRLVRVKRLPGSAMAMLDLDTLLVEKWSPTEKGESWEESPSRPIRIRADNLKLLSQHQAPSKGSIAFKGRHHKHRRAVKRARSTIDHYTFKELDEAEKLSRRYDLSDNTCFSENIVSVMDICLAEERDIGGSKDSFKDSSKFNTISSYSADHELSTEVSEPSKAFVWQDKLRSPEDAFSLSSYKETSPETEFFPPSVETKLKKSSFASGNLDAEGRASNRGKRRVSIDVSGKMALLHGMKVESRESSSPCSASNSFSQNNEDAFVIKTVESRDKMSHSQSGTGARMKDSLYINLSESGEDVSESFQRLLSALQEKATENAEPPLQKDAMCQTQPQFCKQKSSYKKSCIFALDDAELKKRQLQQQRLSSSVHPDLFNQHHHHHHHRLNSMLGRSASYSRHKASKDLIMNATGSSQVVEGASASFQCSMDKKKALCPSASLSAMVRNHKRCLEDDAVAQRLAHHSCATIEGPSWFVNSDSDTPSSDEKSASFDANMSSDSLSSPTCEDELAEGSPSRHPEASKMEEGTGGGGGGGENVPPEDVPQAPDSSKPLKDNEPKLETQTAPIEKESSLALAKASKAGGITKPHEEVKSERELQLMEDFKARIAFLFSSDGIYPRRATAKEASKFDFDSHNKPSCSYMKKGDCGLEFEEFGVIGNQDMFSKLNFTSYGRNISENDDAERQRLLERALTECAGMCNRRDDRSTSGQSKQSAGVSFKGGTSGEVTGNRMIGGIMVDQSSKSSSQSSYQSNFCTNGRNSSGTKPEDDSLNGLRLPTSANCIPSREETVASNLSEVPGFENAESKNLLQCYSSADGGGQKNSANSEGFSGALPSSTHPPPPPPQVPQWTPSRLEIMVNHFFEVTQTRRTHASNARLPAGGGVGGEGSQVSEAHQSLDGEFNDDVRSDSSDANCWVGFARKETGDRKRPRKIFILQVFPWLMFKIRFDRQALQAIFDRNSKLEMFFSVLLAVLVSVFCCLLLSFGIFKDFEFWLCFIVAGSQYSLLKSVQPDAASPIHGHNCIVVFSRPVYFCLCAFFITLLHTLPCPEQSFTFYGITFNPPSITSSLQEITWFFLMFIPVTFVLGLLPQVNTFFLYLLEQIEIHVFGGTAMSNLVGGIYSFVRSSICTAIMCGLCFAFINESPKTALEANSPQHILFSVYCGVLVAISYHLSRYSSDPRIVFQIIKRSLQRRKLSKKLSSDDIDVVDPLPEQLEQSVLDRLHSDLIVCPLTATFVFAVCVSTAFSSPVLQPPLFDLLVYISASLGFILHWLIPQLRIETPWMCLSHPLFKSHERNLFEAKAPSKVMWFEKMYLWLAFMERNVFLPTTFLSAMTVSTRQILETNKFVNPYLTCFVLSICGLKMFRCSFLNPSSQYYVIIFVKLLFQFDFKSSSETFLVDYFFVSIFLHKVKELMLKLKFILTYIAPWQITWGSAFHAFAQPFSIPHSAFLFLQALISSIVSAPLNPLLGSAIFLISYVRPVKFWEKDYNTKRVDHTNTRLVAQIDRSVKFDDDNLNSIFYEHLTRSLQKSLCGDLALGRWGVVNQGDCFVMASDYLNALVHLVEMGNGFVTFQLRGLEFRGTYCQQREVEAITEDLDGNRGFCCCKPGHLPHFLSVNASFNQRWLAWQVVSTKFVAEGYSVSDNSAASMLQVYDLRKMLITFYVKSIIYYAVRSPKLYHWLSNKSMKEALVPMNSREYVDVDPTFAASVDVDYDARRQGVSRASFCDTYLDWIQYCVSRRDKNLDATGNSFLVTLCFALSLLGRRSLGTESHNNASANVEFFLYGLHALFKGDIRINSVRDEWVFADMELLRRVIAPGIRMSLKLHQDHFASPDEYDKSSSLYEAITTHESNMMISHEGDPAWRNAVLSNVPSLLALRHVFDEGTNEYKVIMLTKRYLSFRVIKVNSECVRGFWAGQLQELIFLRNNNSERGSIQNAKQSLRNIINSSCDQPIGYPIYVSPLTTSYLASNSQYSQVAGKEMSFWAIFSALQNAWNRMKTRCSSSCMSGRSMAAAEEQNSARNPPGNPVLLRSARLHLSSSTEQANPTFLNRGSVISSTSSASKPSLALPNLVGFVSDQQQQQLMQHEKLQQLQQQSGKDVTTQRVMITDPSKMFDNINLGRPIDVQWPNEEWRNAGGKSGWEGWVPERGMEGVLVHRWTPCHREPLKRSHVDKTILLVKIGDRYVPLTEAGVAYLGVENPPAFVETIST